MGRLDAWRGFDLAIESFARAAKKNSNIHLTIVGKGGDKERLIALAKELGVKEKITFTGKVEMEEYYRLLAKSDAVINASLKEGAVTVSFDTLAMGKPLICLDTTGYTRYFSNEYAVVIPRTGREQVIEEMSAAITRLCDEQERKAIGEKARTAGNKFTWEARGKEFCELLMSKLQK